MAWAKQAADAGVAGMHEREVVQGVVDGSVDVTPPDIPDVAFIKVVSRSTSIYLSMYCNKFHVGDVEDIYLHSII